MAPQPPCFRLKYSNSSSYLLGIGMGLMMFVLFFCGFCLGAPYSLPPSQATGKPLCRAIVWLDLRTSDTVAKLAEEQGGRGAFRAFGQLAPGAVRRLGAESEAEGPDFLAFWSFLSRFLGLDPGEDQVWTF